MNRMPKDREMLFGYSPDTYEERLSKQREIAAMPDNEDGWSTSGSGFSQAMEKSYLERLLAANDHLDPLDPHSPIQRMNQPMAANISTHWKKKNGVLADHILGIDYLPAQSFKRALLDDQTGGTFKDTIANQGKEERQEWLNQNYGGRGMGYMGQNAYQSNPDMEQRRAAVQANARRIRGLV